MSKLTLNLREIVRFYDDLPEAGKHSNAVKTVAGEELGLALLTHYLNDQKRKPELLKEACTTKGAWLDGWIEVLSPTPMLYQVEVKSWSMHGFGSKNQQLSIDATGEYLSIRKKKMWDHYWHEGQFKQKSLQKVLLKMKIPAGKVAEVEPIACIWTAVHPDGLSEHFFSVPTNNSDFHRVYIFSMSSYLRNLMAKGINNLEIDLPDTKARIDYLNSVFKTPVE